MKYKRNIIKNKLGFTFIIPLTLAIVVGFAVLSIGGYIVGTIGSTLEGQYPDNTESGLTNIDVWHNTSFNSSYIANLSSPGIAELLSGTTSKFYIRANGSFPIYYNLTVNGVSVNFTDQLIAGEGYNHTLTALISGGSVVGGNTSITFQWDVNSTESTAQIRLYGTYHQSSDLRTSNQNSTVFLIGNITAGFSDVVDIEIVVIIITALSMAIFAVMAVGSRRGFL